MSEARKVSIWPAVIYSVLTVLDIVLVAIGNAPVLWAMAAACWSFVAALSWVRWLESREAVSDE